jgi:ribosomal protein L12E/L44/L45/RPP1/RPP2
MIMGAEVFGSGVGALMNNPMFKMTLSGQSFRFQDMGAGEAILGYKTRKVRTFYTSTMETKVLMMNNKITSTDTSDQWIATGVKLDPQNFERWSKAFGSGVKSTNPELAAQMAKYQSEYGRSGIALKTITYSTQVDKKGKVTVDTMTMDVTELQSGAIDAAVFEVPSGYKVTDMSQAIASAKASMDSAAQAGEDKDGKKDDKKKEEKPASAKDALKQGLGGMFKKKPPM